MGTRAAAFTAKIRNLQDYHLRLVNGLMPLPTGTDIANTLKHFSQTLLVVLKDVPHYPLEMLKSREEDAARMQLFPNLDYKALFNVVVQLLDAAPIITIGVQVFGQNILQTIACLLPFLEHESIDTLPYTISASLGTFPISLHSEIIDLLCYYLFPFTLYNCNEGDKFNYAAHSISAVLMMVFQNTSNPEFHSQVMESIMTYKRDAIRDILCVIAYGTSEARNIAINLLVFYWPHTNPTLYDRRSVNFKFNGFKIPICRSEMCSINNVGGGNGNFAVKICMDHSVGVCLSPENAPPLYLCQECATRLQHDQSTASDHLYDVLQPIQQIAMTCENKNCRSNEKAAIILCFSTECASYNGNHPIKYCAQCHSIRHNNRRGGDHVFHHQLQSPLKMDIETLNYGIEAIVSLLLDAEPLVSRGGIKESLDQQARMRLFTEGEFTDPVPVEDRRLMGRYGIWLLVGFINPEDTIINDILGRLLSALFQWFHTNAYIGDDPMASTLERLKADVVCPWLNKIIKIHFDVFVSCLLPHPPEMARVGGHWDVIASRTFHLVQGFNRLFCLVPYDVISPEIWSQIMPNWMEAISTEVPEEEMGELKIILSKVLDIEMNPLGFDARQMYQFIANRFHQTTHKVKEQALRWLQVLSKLEIVIPLYFIFSIFREGIRVKTTEKLPKRGSVQVETGKDAITTICQDDSRNASSLSDEEENITQEAEEQTDNELMLSSYIYMLDIILKQLELQDVEQHKGLHTVVAKDAMILLNCMVGIPWPGKHTCSRESECQLCEMVVVWYQLALEILQKLAPENPVIQPDNLVSPDGEFGSKSASDDKKLDVKADNKQAISPKLENLGLQGMMIKGALNPIEKILSATVETVADLDLAPIMPSENIVRAIARAVTITDSDCASAKAHVASANLIGEDDLDEKGIDGKDFWMTSIGKFKFSIEDLPPYLQFTFELLKKIPDEEDSEILYHLLKCLRILFIHGEVMQKASKDNKGFLLWCQENLLIKNLWELMDPEYSQISEQSVPILLHCITLNGGADVFWKQIECEFHSHDWRIRFIAVERVLLISRFLDTYPIRQSQALQTALASAFCFLIAALDDENVAIAQRAAMYLGTVHDSAMQNLLFCLQSQFDTVVYDRPVILQSLYLLLNTTPDRKVLRWDFFLNCFETLYLEAQINLEKSGDVTYLKDVKSEHGMDQFIKKLHRVQDSLNKQESLPNQAKSLSASLNKPYKRTMSSPSCFKHATSTSTDKEKVYNRQASAPVLVQLKRKGSRHGIDNHIHSLSSGEDAHLIPFFHRIVEFEEADKETIHLLIFIFMQFLLRYNRGPIPSENKALARTQTVVLRHMNMLLGYNPQEKAFFLFPSRLRSSPIFNSFLANLSSVLDQNFAVGSTLVPIALTILHYSPAPNKAAGHRLHPFYSLWLLEPQIRRHWLVTLIVILYKYDYGLLPLSNQVQTVMRIVLNTVNAQEHQCKPLPPSLANDEPTRSRDLSQATLNTNTGDLEQISEHETPPRSPSSKQQLPSSAEAMHKYPTGQNGARPTSSVNQDRKSQQRDSIEIMSSADEGDDIEPELAAIPESQSPKSTDSIEENDGSFRDMLMVEPEIVEVAVESFKPETATVTESPAVYGYIGSYTSKGQQDDGDLKSTSSSSTTTTTSCSFQQQQWHVGVATRISAPPLERLLPVGQTPSSPSIRQARSSKPSLVLPYESPESPMSKMDMMTLGPVVRVDDISAYMKSPSVETTNLERPAFERLLSHGPNALSSPEHAPTTNELKQLEFTQEQIISGRISPKILIKQHNIHDDDNVFGDKDTVEESKTTQQQMIDSKSVGFTASPPSRPQQQAPTHSRIQPQIGVKQSSYRVGDDCIQERCGECGNIIETYSNEELGLCIVALETFIHREPALASPFLPDILRSITRITIKPLFPWQAESIAYLPGGCQSVGHQFLRCVLHQLAPFGVFVQIFQFKFPDRVRYEMFKSITYALTDFNELNPVVAFQLLFESINTKKNLMMDTIAPIIDNIAIYLECLPLESSSSSTWAIVLPLFEIFFRKILPIIQVGNLPGLLRTLTCLLRLPQISSFKSILDPFSKILSFAIQTTGFNYGSLMDLCHLCHRNFMREREKLLLTRVAIFELVQAMKFKSNRIPDSNFLMLVTFILQDSGGSLAPFISLEDFPRFQGAEPPSTPSTGAAECMRQHLTDSIDFLADFHSLSKIKSNYKGIGCGLNQDTIGGVIKGGVAQYIALELSRGNSRENRAIGRHLPWLYNPPSAIQQGPKEFLDCVAHIRVLSWLLLGSLTHTAMFGPNVNGGGGLLVLPLEASCHVADHVHVIMSGFVEQSKSSVLHMSSLFHAFILCQVWTVYLECVGPTAQQSNNSSDPHNVASNILTDFWGKVTPAILQLISHSKVLAEMVNLHFLTLMESLLECNSSVFTRLLPLWTPVLYSHSANLASHISVRLQSILNYPPPDVTPKLNDDATNIGGIEFPLFTCGPVNNILLLKWVQKLQFKMAQIELQSSAATQFYPL